MTSTYSIAGERGSETLAATTVTWAPRRGGRLGQRPAHLARRAVADEAHGVDRLARAAGGDEDLEAVERPARDRAEARLDGGQQLGGLGQPADAPLARRAERAGARLEHLDAALAQRLEVGLRGRRARTSRRSWPERRSAGAGTPARRRSAGCRRRRAASLASVLADAGAIRKRSARSTSARCESGACSGAGSPGKAPRSASRLPLRDQHGRAGDGGERGRADEARRGLGLDHAHRVARLRREARELERLVGRDPAGDAEEDAGHAPLPSADQPR